MMSKVMTVRDQFDRSMVQIVPFSTALRQHFYRLNEAWLRKYFYVEEIDHQVLSDPEGKILAFGGAIWFAVIGDQVVGTCALKPEPKGELELTKMAVDEGYQGLGIGRLLIDAVIEHYQSGEAPALFLETHSKLSPAISLYESVGFVRQANRKADSQYARSDVYMIWRDPGVLAVSPHA